MIASPSITKLLVSVLQRGLDDPGIALGPIVSAARNQPHAIAIALDAQAIADILDLVEPVWAAGYFDATLECKTQTL
jgi:hypothetical protein